VRRPTHVRSRTGSIGTALGWAAAVTATEALARRLIPSRSRAWLIAYSTLGAAGGAALVARRGRVGKPRRRDRAPVIAGLALAAGGYQLGRAALGDRPIGPPLESLWLETAALAGVVAPAEEIIWGGLVQPAVGVVPATVLFAVKHGVVDGRWRRTLGLGLFGLGLGLVRRRSRALALGVHIACNAGGVLLGHLTGRDQF
jgi:membrane protease YdiL (CAAX protease family)